MLTKKSRNFAHSSPNSPTKLLGFSSNQDWSKKNLLLQEENLEMEQFEQTPLHNKKCIQSRIFFLLQFCSIIFNNGIESKLKELESESDIFP